MRPMTVLQFETLQRFDVESIGHFYFDTVESYIRELKILQGAKKNLTISRMEVEHFFQKEVGFIPRGPVMPVFISTREISTCTIPIVNVESKRLKLMAMGLDTGFDGFEIGISDHLFPIKGS